MNEPMKCNTQKRDYFFIAVVLVVCFSYLIHLTGEVISIGDYLERLYLSRFIETQYEVVNQVWIGVVLSILFVGFLHKIPDEAIVKLFGKGNSFDGMFRAAFAGLFLDLCSHGILMVAMKLYKKGVSLGQVMCFLIASPWNSMSITIILASLIGIKWTIVFIILSLLLAIISGLIFDRLTNRSILPANPNSSNNKSSVSLLELSKNMFVKDKLTLQSFYQIIIHGLRSSKIVIKWLCVGIVISGLLNMFMTDAHIGKYFAPTLLGLGITLGISTILEVCSEGLAPVAGEIFNKAKAVGNTFAFLMAGVATDYTEIMIVKETTKSWKTALFIPLVLVPQVIVLAIILNNI